MAFRKPSTPKPALEIPSILLEGDRPEPAAVGGPGEKFALGPTPPAQQFGAETAELPDAYGTRRLFLTARDPHWLYAHWDLTRAQLTRYNAQSADGHLMLRIYADVALGSPISEIHVHPDSRHWFVHVERAAAPYATELGYYDRARKWKRIAASAATFTPPDALASDTTVEFATIPIEAPFEHLLALIKEAMQENLPLAQAVEALRQAGYPELPPAASTPVAAWTLAQERALAQLVSIDQVRRVWIGSLEVTELIRRHLVREVSSLGARQFSLPTSPLGAMSSVSSPFGGGVPTKGFWFNVNAELVIYGATEADAAVTIGGRLIKLRPDGSFSYRFALPDGRYELPIVAVSADQTDGRAAELKFSRKTDFRGEVGAHPQDPSLKPPKPESL